MRKAQDEQELRRMSVSYTHLYSLSCKLLDVELPLFYQHGGFSRYKVLEGFTLYGKKRDQHLQEHEHGYGDYTVYKRSVSRIYRLSLIHI